jgi:hypothetical protein
VCQQRALSPALKDGARRASLVGSRLTSEPSAGTFGSLVLCTQIQQASKGALVAKDRASVGA